MICANLKRTIWELGVFLFGNLACYFFIITKELIRIAFLSCMWRFVITSVGILCCQNGLSVFVNHEVKHFLRFLIHFELLTAAQAHHPCDCSVEFQNQLALLVNLAHFQVGE